MRPARVLEAHRARRLGHAIAADQPDAELLLERRPELLGKSGRAAAGQPQRGQRIGCDGVVVDQVVDGGRNQCAEHGEALTPAGRGHASGIHPFDGHAGGTSEQRCHGGDDHQIVDAHRQDHPEAVALLEVRPGQRRGGQRHTRATVDDRLRSSGRPAGEGDRDGSRQVGRRTVERR